MTSYLAYFYDPSSVPQDGWRSRVTIPCTKDGRALSQRDFDITTRFKYIGHYEIGNTPENVWEEAVAR